MSSYARVGREEEDATPLTAEESGGGARWQPGCRRALPVVLVALALVVTGVLLAAKSGSVEALDTAARGEAGGVISRLGLNGEAWPTGAQATTADVAPDSSPWRVVWHGGVNVRDRPSTNSASLQVKVVDQMVWGVQSGDWLALDNRQGFMLIMSGNLELLRRVADTTPPTPATTPATTTLPTTVTPTTTTVLTTTTLPTTVAATTPILLTTRPVTFSSSKAVHGADEQSNGTMSGFPATANQDVLGHLEWEVSSETVFVRKGKDPTSQILDSRPLGSLLVGTRDGDWLALFHNLGFIQISKNGVDQVKDRLVAYSRVTLATCAAASRFPINSAVACEAAAVTLGLDDPILAFQDTHSVEESGCSFSQSAGLLFSLKSSPGGTPGTFDKLICASKPYHSSMAMQPASRALVLQTSPELQLFCWMVAMSKKRLNQTDSEVDLVRSFYGKRVGIFGCDRWTVFSDRVVPISIDSTVQTRAIPGPMSKMGAIPNMPGKKMLLNTGVFFRAWGEILQGTLYSAADWTIKLDPDAVFFPDRIKSHLPASRFKPSDPWYLKNCKKWDSMQGPLEIFSRGAVDLLKDGMLKCQASIRLPAIGEDIFLQKCAVLLGMWAGEDDWSLLQDQYCGQYRNPCEDGWGVAFHPYKSIADWDRCWYKAVCNR